MQQRLSVLQCQVKNSDCATLKRQAAGSKCSKNHVFHNGKLKHPDTVNHVKFPICTMKDLIDQLTLLSKMTETVLTGSQFAAEFSGWLLLASIYN